MTSFRQTYGLRWQRERLSMADLREWIKTALLIGFIVLAFGLAGSIDYAIEQREAAERAERTLVACMNGEARFLADGEHTDGFGKVAVLCQRAQEMKL